VASLGCYGAAVPHVGLSGTSDRVVWRYAYENDLTVITTNAKDFLALLNVEVHPGLIVLRESRLALLRKVPVPSGHELLHQAALGFIQPDLVHPATVLMG
jgi:predicted nuclease of predicted toxin-antitoxin system